MKLAILCASYCSVLEATGSSEGLSGVMLCDCDAGKVSFSKDIDLRHVDCYLFSKSFARGFKPGAGDVGRQARSGSVLPPWRVLPKVTNYNLEPRGGTFGTGR